MKKESIMDLQEGKKLFSKFQKNKIKEANIIIDVLKILKENGPEVKVSMTVLVKIFSLLIKEKDIKDMEAVIQHESMNDLVKYQKWLHNCYMDFHKELLNMIGNSIYSQAIQEAAITNVLKLFKLESQYPFTREVYYSVKYPLSKLLDLYHHLMTLETDVSFSMIQKLKEDLKAPEFLIVSLHVLSLLADNKNVSEKRGKMISSNMIWFLQLIRVPKKTFKIDDGEVEQSMRFGTIKRKRADDYKYNENNPNMEPVLNNAAYTFPVDDATKLLSEVVEWLIRKPMAIKMQKHLLTLLPPILATLRKPIALTQFFMNAYNTGGLYSLLAIEGVYILVTQFNLDYPDFFTKVYALLTPEAFNSKCRVKFFTLCNMFFKSSMLPEYLATAFVKRASRLLLTAPTYLHSLLLKFISNILMWFPSLRRMIHKPDAPLLEDDPFKADEADPKLCCAGDSSLWEVATLQCFPILPFVNDYQFLSGEKTYFECDLNKAAIFTYEDLYFEAGRIKTDTISTTFIPPGGIFQHKDDKMSPNWSML